MCAAYSAEAKTLHKLRLVCKDWKKAIDNKVNLRVTIDDSHYDLKPMSHLRVSSCKIKTFCRQLPENYRLFQTLTKQLLVIGEITVDNFEKLIQCSNGPEHLYLSYFPLTTENLMRTLCAEGRHRQFWDNLSKLAIEVCGFHPDDSETVRENIICLFGCRMNNLKSLSLEIFNFEGDNCIPLIDSVIKFLSDHPTLVTLHVEMTWSARHGDPETFDDNLREKLAKAKLESLDIAINASYVRAWTRLITSLKTLKRLSVRIMCGIHFTLQTIPENFPMNSFKEALANNKDTLTSVDLHLYGIIPPINAEIFSGMTNLKQLSLHNFDGVEKEIVNLKLLPASLEQLKLSELICKSDDIEEMKSRLPNTQLILLNGEDDDDISSEIQQSCSTVREDDFYDFTFSGLDPFILF